MNGDSPISVASLSQDSFYRDLVPDDQALAKKSEYNFDHPRSIDDDSILKVLEDISNGRKGRIPIYDFKVCSKNLQKKSEKTIKNRFFRCQITDFISKNIIKFIY